MEPERAMGDMFGFGGQHNASLADGGEHLQRRGAGNARERVRAERLVITNLVLTILLRI